MHTKTFTLLVTVLDDGTAAVFNPIILAAAVKGALEQGCEFVLDSAQAEAIKGHPLIRATVGQHRLAPAVSAEVDAFDGDWLCVKPLQTAQVMAAAKRTHRDLREGR